MGSGEPVPNKPLTKIDRRKNPLEKMAKASFSAYVLVNNLLKTGEKVHFSTKKSTTNFGLPFCFFPFPFFASKWLKYAVFAFQKAKNVGRKRGLRRENSKTSSGDCAPKLQISVPCRGRRRPERENFNPGGRS